MIRRLSKRYLSFIALCGCLILGSCVHRVITPDDADQPLLLNNSPVVMLHIGTINAGNRAANVQERIRSLRIIMIHEAGNSKYIEANRLIDTKMADLNFCYIFQKRTVVGKKSFYLIANEESVKSITLAEGSFPAGMEANPTLTAFLNAFNPDMPTDDDTAPTNICSAAEFEALLNAISFEPELTYGQSGGMIFLPYSAYYGFEVKASDGYEVDYTDSPMYLVPVATKFSFKFINERTRTDVAIDYFALEKTNKTNYLMPNLESWELNKNIGRDKYYWIDWLKFIADELQNAEPGTDHNINMNNMYGWIRDYKMPFPDDAYTYEFVPDGYADDPETDPCTKTSSWVLPVAEEKDGKTIATTAEYGPFYLPEGHNMVEDIVENPNPGSSEPVSADLVEKYILKLRMRDVDIPVADPSPVKVKSAETEISNLKSLFRNTSVQITVTLREGGVNIYAEPVLWNKEELFGYVKDEDEIK